MFLLDVAGDSGDNDSMFVREKSARGDTYRYLVKNEREGDRVRQRIIRALGRKDALLASGELERLAASLARHCDRAIILSDMEAGRIACTRIGGPLLFGRLWERLGIVEVLASCSPTAGLNLSSRVPPSPVSCIGCSCRARIAAARNG